MPTATQRAGPQPCAAGHRGAGFARKSSRSRPWPAWTSRIRKDRCATRAHSSQNRPATGASTSASARRGRATHGELWRDLLEKW